MKRTRYYYLVAGLEEDDNNIATLCISNEHCLHTSKLKAQLELNNIINEVRILADEEGFEFDYVLRDDGLTITYETGTTEYYTIRKIRLN